MTKLSLKNKVALVTGSTSGIGLGVAKTLAREGASVILNGLLDAGQVENLLADFQKQTGTVAHFLNADLSDAVQIEQLTSKAFERFGGIDILVNNAGIQHVAPIEDFPPEKWNLILAVNLSSAFHLIQKTLPRMRQKGWGRIINIASTHGLVASANKSAYVAAKHGLIGLTKVVALETAQSNVTCNAICPGWVLTPLVEQQILQRAQSEQVSIAEAQRRLLADKQPSEQFVTVDQIGAAAAFFCSENASQIRGISMNIDGGWLAQ